MLSAGSQPEACILNMKHILDAFAVHYLFNVSTFVSTFSYNLPVTGMIIAALCTIPCTSIIVHLSLLLYVQYHEQPVCTSLLFTLLFIKSQYTVFCFLFLYILLFFCTSCCFFAHLIVFCTSHCPLHILVFCTSYCFALFYFIAHFILISPFLTICMPLCYVTYIICILNKETLNLEP